MPTPPDFPDPKHDPGPTEKIKKSAGVGGAAGGGEDDGTGGGDDGEEPEGVEGEAAGAGGAADGQHDDRDGRGGDDDGEGDAHPRGGGRRADDHSGAEL